MSRNKVQIDPINPVCGQRLRLLLNEFKITQKEFAITVNQDPSYICRLVNGRQRLSPDTARFYIKTAFDGKGIRWEWLMGYDDSMTGEDYVREMIREGEERIDLETSEFERKTETVRKILSALQMDMYPSRYDTETRKMIAEGAAYGTFLEILESDNTLLKDVFTETGIQEIRAMYLEGRIRETEVHPDEFGMTEEEWAESLKEIEAEEAAFDKYTLENPQAWLDEYRRIGQKSAESMLQEEYDLFDTDGNLIVQFTAREKEDFVNQIYDVVTALIQYHITKKKGQA